MMSRICPEALHWNKNSQNHYILLIPVWATTMHFISSSTNNLNRPDCAVSAFVTHLRSPSTVTGPSSCQGRRPLFHLDFLRKPCSVVHQAPVSRRCQRRSCSRRRCMCPRGPESWPTCRPEPEAPLPVHCCPPQPPAQDPRPARPAPPVPRPPVVAQASEPEQAGGDAANRSDHAGLATLCTLPGAGSAMGRLL